MTEEEHLQLVNEINVVCSGKDSALAISALLKLVQVYATYGGPDYQLHIAGVVRDFADQISPTTH